ncbi:methyltransferase domain-containing protein [Clostridiales bacterium BX7]|uniref:Methyltransferase domain-containing protein n=2 Tax=Feifania hominis TaxID=2763660 RepID=A0A926DFV6_9FIRM|nr:methyltransferase domain-containing protein [Feifania hominis]MBC8536534.1 methyltransferase domain-containing protein [Feifania hominis]
MDFAHFLCPVCKSPLRGEPRRYVCPAGHSFDRAARGYVHLLPSNRMHAKIPGDNREMVLSRRRFLDAGGYALFARALCELAAPLVPPGGIAVDAGCGEGYYTAALAGALPDAAVCGYDIAKCAVDSAARRGARMALAVAGSYDIPLASGCADLVTDVFAPVVPGEFRRILKPGGWFLLAVPGPRHLFALKELLYERPYENEVRDVAYEGFRYVSRTPVRGQLTLDDPRLIWDLFTMTPYYWKTGVEAAQRLRQATRLDTEIEFDFLSYQAV